MTGHGTEELLRLERLPHDTHLIELRSEARASLTPKNGPGLRRRELVLRNDPRLSRDRPTVDKPVPPETGAAVTVAGATVRIEPEVGPPDGDVMPPVALECDKRLVIRCTSVRQRAGFVPPVPLDPVFGALHPAERSVVEVVETIRVGVVISVRPQPRSVPTPYRGYSHEELNCCVPWCTSGGGLMKRKHGAENPRKALGPEIDAALILLARQGNPSHRHVGAPHPGIIGSPLDRPVHITGERVDDVEAFALFEAVVRRLP